VDAPTAGGRETNGPAREQAPLASALAGEARELRKRQLHPLRPLHPVRVFPPRRSRPGAPGSSVALAGRAGLLHDLAELGLRHQPLPGARTDSHRPRSLVLGETEADQLGKTVRDLLLHWSLGHGWDSTSAPSAVIKPTELRGGRSLRPVKACDAMWRRRLPSSDSLDPAYGAGLRPDAADAADSATSKAAGGKS
jgi:hypothetical protein